MLLTEDEDELKKKVIRKGSVYEEERFKNMMRVKRKRAVLGQGEKEGWTEAQPEYSGIGLVKCDDKKEDKEKDVCKNQHKKTTILSTVVNNSATMLLPTAVKHNNDPAMISGINNDPVMIIRGQGRADVDSSPQ